MYLVLSALTSSITVLLVYLRWQKEGDPKEYMFLPKTIFREVAVAVTMSPPVTSDHDSDNSTA